MSRSSSDWAGKMDQYARKGDGMALNMPYMLIAAVIGPRTNRCRPHAVAPPYRRVVDSCWCLRLLAATMPPIVTRNLELPGSGVGSQVQLELAYSQSSLAGDFYPFYPI